MGRPLARSTFCCMLGAALAGRAGAQDQVAPLTTRRIADGLYVISPPPDSVTANVVVALSDEGLLLSDCGLGVERENVAAAIAGLPASNRAIRYIVNSHWHRDHTGGNRYFGQGATIVAHTYTREMLTKPQKLLGSTVQPAPEAALPTRTFDENDRIAFGGADIDLTQVPAAHTGGDIYVRFARQDVLHIGDVYYGPVFPWVDADHGGSIIGIWRAVRALLAGPKYAAIVPGHGPLVTTEALLDVDRMMTDSFSAVREGLRQQLALADIQKRGLDPKWASWSWVGNSTEAWIAAVYATIQGGESAP